MSKADRCDLKGCEKSLSDRAGFEFIETVFAIDRSDRDADSFSVTRHACSLEHARALEPASRREFLDRFTPEGKQRRSTGAPAAGAPAAKRKRADTSDG